MTPEQLVHLLQLTGPAGLVLVAALLALRHVHNKFLEAIERRNEVQEKRIADAQMVAQKFAEMMSSQHQTNALLVKAIESNADAVRELRMGLESALAERGIHRLPTSGGRR